MHHANAPDLKVGDIVYLEETNIKTTSPVEKSGDQRHRLFKVVDQISSHAFRLELPASWRIHDVFHISLLTPVKEDTIGGCEHEKPPPEINEGEEYWKVSEILDSQCRNRRLEYFIRWEEYGPKENKWEPADIMKEDILELIEAFHAQYHDAWSRINKPPTRVKSKKKSKKASVPRSVPKLVSTQ